MSETTKPGTPVNPRDAAAVGGGASEGDCLTPDTPDQQPSNDSPWWRSLQDALGNMLR